MREMTSATMARIFTKPSGPASTCIAGEVETTGAGVMAEDCVSVGAGRLTSGWVCCILTVALGRAGLEPTATMALPKAFDLGNPRIMTSTEALDLEEIPESLLVIGGGYIGMELGTVYARLGSKVVVVEALDAILAGADADLVRPVVKLAEQNFKQIRLKTSTRS